MKRLLILALALASGAEAQEVIAPGPPPALSAWLSEHRSPELLPEAEPLDVMTVPGEASPVTITSRADSTPFQWGPFALHPFASYRLLYGSGIQSGPGDPRNTAIQDINAGFFLLMGEHWILNYSPTWTTYSDAAFQDTLSQVASLTGTITYENVGVGLSESVSTSNAPLAETGAQTQVRTYATAVNVSCSLGQFSLFSSLSASIQDTTGLTDTAAWSTSDGFRYKFTPEIDAGATASASYSVVNPGANLASGGLTAVVDWRPTKKISLDLEGGVERQAFLGGNSSGQNTPTVKSSVQYALLDTTQLTMSVSRSLQGSAFANSSTEVTGWNATLDQRLLQQLHLSFGFGQQHTSYQTAVVNTETGRSDSTTTANKRLNVTLLQRGSIGLGYSENRDASSLSGFSFTSHQVEIDIGYRY